MITHAEINLPIPDFMINATGNTHGALSDYHGKNIVLFFYPRDNTPVCTSEAKAFRDHYQEFIDRNTVVFGISRDTLASHERFKAKLSLPYELIADTQGTMCTFFDVVKDKSFFGKKIQGIVRSTFLINPEGLLQNAWRNIKVSGHIDEVLSGISS